MIAIPFKYYDNTVMLRISESDYSSLWLRSGISRKTKINYLQYTVFQLGWEKGRVQKKLGTI